MGALVYEDKSSKITGDASLISMICPMFMPRSYNIICPLFYCN